MDELGRFEGLSELLSAKFKDIMKRERARLLEVYKVD